MEESSTFDKATVRARLRRLPVFPLPNAVLLPGGHLPLHVFEPRYRALVRDALASDRMLAVALLREDESGAAESGPPAFHAVTGLGRISAQTELPDGRFYVLLEGLMRTRVVQELRSDEPYRLVRAIPVPDDEPMDWDRFSLSGKILRRLVLDLARHLPEDTGGPLVKACTKERDPGRLADIVGSAILADNEQRQRFLEESDAERRLDLMTLAISAVLQKLGDRNGSNAPN